MCIESLWRRSCGRWTEIPGVCARGWRGKRAGVEPGMVRHEWGMGFAAIRYGHGTGSLDRRRPAGEGGYFSWRAGAHIPVWGSVHYDAVKGGLAAAYAVRSARCARVRGLLRCYPLRPTLPKASRLAAPGWTAILERSLHGRPFATRGKRVAGHGALLARGNTQIST